MRLTAIAGQRGRRLIFGILWENDMPSAISASPHAYARELAEARAAAQAASAEILALYRTFETIEDAPADISTEADRASQEIILRRLSAAFPGDGFCGEESTATLAELRRTRPSEASRVWIVDPIDGSRGFAKKNGEFSVMIGLVEDGRAVLGVVHEPAADRTTFASLGQGCFVHHGSETPRRVAVKPTTAWPDAVVAMSRSRKPEAADRLLAIFGAGRGVATYSAGIKLAQVARGEADLYVGDYPAMHDWDLAAGVALVEEAGGRATDFAGRPLAFGRPPYKQAGGLLATNGRLHADALTIVQSKPAGLY
jgi:3'(2'), 5'-bisphosphate nucleotidase